MSCIYINGKIEGLEVIMKETVGPGQYSIEAVRGATPAPGTAWVEIDGGGVQVVVTEPKVYDAWQASQDQSYQSGSVSGQRTTQAGAIGDHLDK